MPKHKLQAGQPAKKGNTRGAAYAYNVKMQRDQEMVAAAHAERAYEQFVARWQPTRPKKAVRERLNPARHE